MMRKASYASLLVFLLFIQHVSAHSTEPPIATSDESVTAASPSSSPPPDTVPLVGVDLAKAKVRTILDTLKKSTSGRATEAMTYAREHEETLRLLLSSCKDDVDSATWEDYWEPAVRTEPRFLALAMFTLLQRSHRFADPAHMLQQILGAVDTLARVSPSFTRALIGEPPEEKEGEQGEEGRVVYEGDRATRLFEKLLDVLRRYGVVSMRSSSLNSAAPASEPAAPLQANVTTASIHLRAFNVLTGCIVLRQVEADDQSMDELIARALLLLHVYPESVKVVRTVVGFLLAVRRAYALSVTVPSLLSGLSLLRAAATGPCQELSPKLASFLGKFADDLQKARDEGGARESKAVTAMLLQLSDEVVPEEERGGEGAAEMQPVLPGEEAAGQGQAVGKDEL